MCCASRSKAIAPTATPRPAGTPPPIGVIVLSVRKATSLNRIKVVRRQPVERRGAIDDAGRGRSMAMRKAAQGVRFPDRVWRK